MSKRHAKRFRRSRRRAVKRPSRKTTRALLLLVLRAGLWFIVWMSDDHS